MNRRTFLKRTSLAAGAWSAASLLPAPNLLAAGPGNKLNCVQIGCGIRSKTHLEWLVNQSRDNLVAIVDADEKQHAETKRWLQRQGVNPGKVQTFTDYRQMFDKIGKQLDA